MRHILRPTAQRHMQLVHKGGRSISPIYPTPPPSAGPRPRRYSYLPSPVINCVNDLHYMVSGAPGSADMKITMIPDDLTKHSTKRTTSKVYFFYCF